MGSPANFVWLPLLLMATLMAMAPLAIAQTNDTTSNSSNNVSSSTTNRPSTEADVVVGGDLSKAARVEELDKDLEPSLSADTVTPKSADGGPYDVVDVLAATSAGVGRPKSGQTTRIYTTGDVNDDFWLKHLGDDFKHAIHLQVGGTNDDYNRIINQTSNGVHEEVHHEYLPGAERPPEMQQQQQQQQSNRAAGFGHPNLVSQLSLDGEAMALKNNYLSQQAQRQQLYSEGYAQQNTRYNTHRHTYPHMHTQHNTQHTHTHSHSHPRAGKSRQTLRNRYKSNYGQNANTNLAASGFISSSEDTLHASPSQPSSTSAISPSSSSPPRDDMDSQLPFKSPFNDYGSRPTRDLTYLLYKRGL